MSIARDRANRSGTDPLQIDNTKLVTDSGDLKIQDVSGNEKKLIADELHIGTGADKVILKRDSSTGKVAIQTQAAGEAAEGGTVASTTVYATTALLPTNPTDGQQALVTANNFMFIAKSNGWYKIAEITNTAPSVTSAGNASYQFLTDGTPVSIEITATDSEVGTALQYKYVVSSGSIGSSATVTSSATSGGTYSALAANTLTTNKFFKVTPSTNNAHAGTFSLTFSASDGVAVGTSSASSFTLQFDVNASYKFDGNGDAITVPTSTDFNFDTGDFTIEAFVQSNAHSGNPYIIDLRDEDASPTSQAAPLIYINNSNQILYYVSGSARITVDYSNYDNKFTHIAAQRNSGTTTLYLDGVEKGTWSDSTNYNQSNPTVRLGSRYGYAAQSLNGYMSNVRIVKGSAVYTATDPGGASSASSSYGMLSTPASLPSWGTTWTLETWIYITNNSSYMTFFHNFGGSSSYIARRQSSGGLEVYLMGGFSDSPGSGTFPLNEWVHIALSNNSGSLKNFINGVQVSSGTANTAPHSGGSGTLNMMAQGGNTWPTLGYMSDTRLVIGTSVYSGNFTPPSGALTKTGGTYPSTTNVNTAFPAGHTYLLTNRTSSGTTIADNSDQNYTMVTAGALTGSTTKPYSATFTAPTTGLTAVTNTKLLALTESEPLYTTNGSYLFNAEAENLLINHADMALGSGDWTIDWWFQIIGTPSSNNWFFSIGTSNSDAIQCYYTQSGNHLNFWDIGGNGSMRFALTNHGSETGEWYHARFCRHGNNHYVFINGNCIGGSASNGSIITTGTSWTRSYTHAPSSNDCRIGGYFGGNYGWEDGMLMSDFRIIKGTALQTSAAKFNVPTTASTAVSGTVLLTCQGDSNVLTDNSGTSKTITMGQGTVTSDSRKVPGVSEDKSSSPHTLSFEGNVSHSYAAPFAQGSGGSALFGEYVGATANIGTLIPTASSDFTLGTGDYCIDGWFKNTMPVNTSTTHNQRLFDLGDNGCRIFFKNGEIKAQTGSSTQMTYSPGADFGTNTWHHFALQRSSGTTKFFLGGLQRTSISDTQNHATTACKIGGYGGNDTDSYKFQGYISDFRVVKGATVYTPTSPSNYYGSFTGGPVYKITNASITGTAAGTGLSLGTGAWTVEAWIYTSSTSWSLIDFGLVNGTHDQFVTDSGNSYFGHNDGSAWNSLNWWSSSDNGKWNHIAYVSESSTVKKIYKNGVLRETITTGASSHYGYDSADIVIGERSDGYYRDTGMKLSNLRVVKGTAVYTGAFTPTNSPLTAISGTGLLAFQQHTGSPADRSGNSVPLVADHAGTASTDTPFVDAITLPTSKSTAITGTVLLTCQQSTGDFTDASSSNHTISQGATGTVLATRHQPY